MLIQYAKFFLNGGVLGVAAWALQWAIYKALGEGGAFFYGIATALTYVPLIFLNFSVQRAWIFKRSGLFWRFVLANLFIMFLVSSLSSLLQIVIDGFLIAPWGSRAGFLLAALIGSVPSFFIKKIWVFGEGAR